MAYTFGAPAMRVSSSSSWSGAWPFGVVEAIWAAVALQRWRRVQG